jgi:hypothetical protein
MFFTTPNYPGAPGNIGNLLAGGNFLGGKATEIRGGRPAAGSRPLLPGEDPNAIQGVYGPGQPLPMPTQLQLPQAYAPNVFNMMGQRSAQAAGFDRKFIS